MSKKSKYDRYTRGEDPDLADFDSAYDEFKGTTSKSLYKSCYLSHPVLEIAGGKLVGGRCSSPIEKADAYIGLDHSMKMHRANYPWDDPAPQPLDIEFPISDGQAPKDVEGFKKMVDWVVGFLGLGNTVHIGCIGGHGRTGMLISAIVCKATGNLDSTTWVRENYCKKAVETDKQIDFLHTHFGITKADPSKKPMVQEKFKSESNLYLPHYPSYTRGASSLYQPHSDASVSVPDVTEIKYLPGPGGIW